MNRATAVREELLGLPRLHGKRSDGERTRQKLGNKRALVASRSIIGSNTFTNNNVSNATIAVETADGSELDFVHPSSPRVHGGTDEQAHSTRPNSTPGVSRSPMHPHYRSDTHSAVARRPTTSDPAVPRAHFSDQKHQNDNASSDACTGSGINADYMRALAELQDENDSLRHNIRQLHAKLLEKMRGANKVVGGGQFRVMTTTPGNAGVIKRPIPLSDHPGCSKCSSLRGESARLRHELTRVADANEELKRYVEALEQRQTVWCAERDVQRMEIEQLVRDVGEGNQTRAVACADRDQFQQQQLVLQGELERVKAELVEGAAKKVGECVVAGASEAAATQDASIQAALTLENPRERDEEEERRRQQERELVSHQLMALQSTAGAAQKSLVSEWERHQSTETEIRQRLGLLQLHLDDQQAIVERLNGGIASLSQENSRLTKELATRDQEIIDCKRHNLTSIDEMVATHQALLADSQHAHDDVICGLKAANTDLERRICELEAEKAEHAAQIHRLAGEIALMSEQIRDYQASVDRDDTANNRVGDSIDPQEMSRLADQLKHAETSLQSALATLNETRDRADSLQVDVEERDEVIARMRDSHGRALERALDKTLRICVVAPTVNVHLSKLSSSKKSLSSTSTEVAQCRSSPPRHAIQDIVEKEVLPFFSKIMVQPDPSDRGSQNNCATGYDSTAVSLPSGVPTDAWLQQLFDGMKQQLADRIESVYTSLTPSSR